MYFLLDFEIRLCVDVFSLYFKIQFLSDCEIQFLSLFIRFRNSVRRCTLDSKFRQLHPQKN